MNWQIRSDQNGSGKQCPRRPGASWKLRLTTQKSHVIMHYGVLGMRWGIRKDEVGDDVWNFFNDAEAEYIVRLNEPQTVEGFMEGEDFVGGFDPLTYLSQDEKIEISDRINNTGLSDFFNADAWNSATPRERGAAYDYATTEGCRLMNGLLRGALTDSDITSKYNEDTAKNVRDSINMLSSLIQSTPMKENAMLGRKTSYEGLAGLLGIDENDFSDTYALRSLIGTRCVEPGFMSTTLIRGGYNMGSGYGDINVFINARKGSKGLYLEPACQDTTAYKRGCYEVTLDKGSQFDIVNIDINEDGTIRNVFMDLVEEEDR